MQKSILSWIFFIIVAQQLYHCYQPPLPYYAPPTSNASRVSTNLEALLFNGNQKKMEKLFMKQFKNLDDNKDDMISVDELVDQLNKTSSYNATDPDDLLDIGNQLIRGYRAADSDKNGNVTLQELTQAFVRVFQTNFTLQPSICLDTADRINLCALPMDSNITDYTILESGIEVSAKAFFAREQAKCKSGVSGLEDNFAFQRCVLGNPCNRVISECFGRRFIGDVEEVTQDNCENAKQLRELQIAESSSLNIFIDKKIQNLTELPYEDPQFQNYIYAVDNQYKKNDIRFLISKLFVENFKNFVVYPLAQMGTSALVATIVAYFAGLAAPAAAAVGALAGIAFLIVAGIRDIALMIPLLGGSDRGDLVMESWSPSINPTPPQCSWTVYQEQKCWTERKLAGDYEKVCDHGGQVYRSRPCDGPNQKQFYQTQCILGCRRLCLVTDFNCGADGYSYRNLTEFIKSKPSASINQHMFNPDYMEGDQYALLDSRHVFFMSECRNTCNMFESYLSEGKVGRCIGFVLQAPDPLLDTRTAYNTRQVCHLIGKSKENTAVKSENGTIYMNKSIESNKYRSYPVFLTSTNDLFQYDVMTDNAYPPLVVAFKD